MLKVVQTSASTKQTEVPDLPDESPLDEIAREGARRMLAAALRAEADAYVDALIEVLDEDGHRMVVRNGYAEPRTVMCAAGAIEARAPRVNDKRVDEATGERKRFSSTILPAWCRKSPRVSEVLPLLYLHGLSTSDFGPALGQFLGSSAGLSAPVIAKLTQTWQGEQRTFATRDLSQVDYVYLWADGIHVKIRQQAQLVLLQADLDVDAVGPEIDVVDLREVAGSEGALLALPRLGQLGDHRRGQARGRSQELAQRRTEVTGRQPMQVQQRQHLADPRGLAAPRRQDCRGEPLALAGGLIDALVVDPRRARLDRAGRAHHRARLGVTVAHHHPMPVLVEHLDQRVHVGVGLRAQRRGQHPPCPFAGDLVQRRLVRQIRHLGLLRRRGCLHYLEHGRAFPTGVAPPACLRPTRSPGRYALPSPDPQVSSIALRDVVVELEELGYGTLWIGEAVYREPLTHAGFLLSSTKRMVIATGIANIWARDPFTMTAAQFTLAEAYPDRFLELSSKPVDEPLA